MQSLLHVVYNPVSGPAAASPSSLPSFPSFIPFPRFCKFAKNMKQIKASSVLLYYNLVSLTGLVKSEEGNTVNGD